MLLQIRDFIRRAGVVSTQQLEREFHSELNALQPMLDIWESKGIIRKCAQPTNCRSTCFKCGTHPFSYYQYIEISH